jgi:hypothetical protein
MGFWLWQEILAELRPLAVRAALLTPPTDIMPLQVC